MQEEQDINKQETTQQATAPAPLGQVERLVIPPELPCICEGNWRNIIHESEPSFGKKFTSPTGYEYIFCGVMCGGDDYYYCLQRGSEMQLLSCVGSIFQHGYTEV